MTVELIRHGLTVLQAEQRYQGRTDVPLSPEGIADLRQAEHAPARVYVSPLLRARQTAAVLFPASEQIVVKDLREMNFGAFEGKNYLELAENADYRSWVEGGCLGRCPGGESKDEFCCRVRGAFGALLAGAMDRGELELVIVAHGGTMMGILEQAGRPERDYYDWQRPAGCGWQLDTARWAAEGTLAVLAETDHTKGGN